MSTMNSGKCVFCEKSYSSQGMTRHLKSCKDREAWNAKQSKKGEQMQLFHLKISGEYRPGYWIHVEADERFTLAELDQFLRAVWLECCGHLSRFEGEDAEYNDEEFLEPPDPWFSDFGPPGKKQLTMDVPLEQVFQSGSTLDYEYDFGSTTHL